MNNWKKITLVIMVVTVLMLPLEVFAESTSFADDKVKMVCLGVAGAAILLLLYLGYRMDSNDVSSEKRQKTKSKKQKVDDKSNYVKKQTNPTYTPQETVYEEDKEEYVSDNVNPDEITDAMEYEEDFEDIKEPEKFEEPVADFGETISFDSSMLKNTVNDDTSFDDFEDVEEVEEIEEIEEIQPVEEEEEFGEEFDTSIIDNIDEEDDLFSTVAPKNKNVEEEIDDFEDIEEVKEVEEIGEEFDTSIIDEIDNFDEEYDNKLMAAKEEAAEEEFEGFSVGAPKKVVEEDEDDFEDIDDFAVEEVEEVEEVGEEYNNFDAIDELEDIDDIDDFEEIEEVKPVVEEVVEKPKKRYTKVVKKVEETSDLEDEFMRQMEANLELGDEEEPKKITKKTSTRKKKEN